MSLNTRKHILSLTSLLFSAVLLSLVTGNAHAQSGRNAVKGKTDLNARLKRIYLFTDASNPEENQVDYTQNNQVSVRSRIDNSTILTGQNAAAHDSATVRNYFMHVIDIASAPKPSEPEEEEVVEKDSVVELFAQKVISDAPEKDFSVFPNPIDNSQREITLDFEGMDKGSEIQMMLVDVQGRVIAQNKFTLEDSKKAVAVPKLYSGTYFVKVNGQEQAFAKKLLVK